MSPREIRMEKRSKRLSLDIMVAKSRYFVRQGSSGLIFGPRQTKDGIPKHVTIPIHSDGGVINAHMKSGQGDMQREDWRIFPEKVGPSIAMWIREHSTPCTPSELETFESSGYCVSARRVIVMWTIIQGLIVPAMLLGRGLCLWQVRQDRKGDVTRFQAALNFQQLRRFILRLRPFRGLLASVGRTVIPKIALRLAKLTLANLKDMSLGDTSLLFFRGPSQPLVVVKYDKHLALSFEEVLREAGSWYSRSKINEFLPELSETSPSPSDSLFLEVTAKGIMRE